MVCYTQNYKETTFEGTQPTFTILVLLNMKGLEIKLKSLSSNSVSTGFLRDRHNSLLSHFHTTLAITLKAQ